MAVHDRYYLNYYYDSNGIPVSFTSQVLELKEPSTKGCSTVLAKDTIT
jgi:hypothetical protein